MASDLIQQIGEENSELSREATQAILDGLAAGCQCDPCVLRG